MEQIRKILKQQKVIDSIRQESARCLDELMDAFDTMDLDLKDEYDSVTAREYLADFVASDSGSEPSFISTIMSQLDEPTVITSEELYSTFSQHMVIRREGEFDDQFKQFKKEVLLSVHLIQRSAPIPTVTLGTFDGAHLKQLVGMNVWEGPNKFSVEISGLLPAEARTALSRHAVETLYLTAQGRCSPRAFQRFVSTIRDVGTTALRNDVVLNRADGLLDIMKMFEDLESNREPENESDDDDCDSSDMAKLNSLRLVSDTIDGYFIASTRKDSISRRIRNAIHLLVAADQQPHDSVGLALCVACTEALLCESGEGLARMFSENVATLLEPEPRSRDDAVTFALALYNKRSRVFHGSETECSTREYENARLLAAAVLRGFIERRTFRRMAGYEDETPTGLLVELRKDKYTPGQLTGVASSPATRLWRDNSG
jgi:hypothetical protein